MVGEDGLWEQNGTILSYEGTGYTYYTDTEELENGCLVLEGTGLDGYYTFQYSETEEGKLTYEAPGVISLNFENWMGIFSHKTWKIWKLLWKHRHRLL